MNLLSWLKSVVRRLLLLGGVVLLFCFALCWTPYPWRMYHWFTMPEAVLIGEPAWIVVLGGGGIPSESGLMRTYYGAQWAARYPDARVVAALPGDPANPGSAVNKMRGELILRGVAPERVVLAPRGTSTRAQALELVQLLGEEAAAGTAVLIVTSPEHVRRSVRSFQKAGMDRVGALPALDTSADHSMETTEEGVGDTLRWPGLEGSLTLRYRFWNNLDYLTRAAREATALAYYRVKGWV